jgi:tetratricopeptide (TPR) repeat protein
VLRKAISNANLALSKDPSSPIAIRALSHIQHSTGRAVEGLVMARQALENDPDDLDATAAAAEAYFRTGLCDRAIPLYEKALAAEPDNREFRTQLARIYFFLGEYKKGVEVISALPPSQVGTFGMLLYAETGEMSKALQAAARPDRGMGGFSRFVRGSVLTAAGDLAGAREIWTEAVRNGEALLAKNENPGVRYGLSLNYARLGKKEQALFHIHHALAPDPRHPVFLFFAAEVYALLGDRRRALDSLKAAVENGFFNLPMIEAMARSSICTLYTLRDDPEFLAIRADLARRVDELRSRY